VDVSGKHRIGMRGNQPVAESHLGGLRLVAK
jgi:hypothetical protein